MSKQATTRETEMTKTTMTLSNTDWTRAGMIEDWADDETLTPVQQVAAADSQMAYLINNTHTEMPGWRYDSTTGTFTGPAPVGDKIRNPYCDVLAVIGNAVDYVIEHLDEIRADEV